MSDEDTARVETLIAQWPTLDEMLGCVNCKHVFRDGAQCPRCESSSLLNVAEIIAEHEQPTEPELTEAGENFVARSRA